MKQHNSKDDSLNFDNLPDSVRIHIDRLERIRRDFVANVSHELRTPLTVIHGYLEILRNKDDNENIKSFKDIFDQMYNHSIRMESMINELLLLSRLENKDQLFEEQKNIAVSDMLQTLCTDAKYISGKKAHVITLKSDPDLYLRGTEEELKSLFSNIIVNAVKYTPDKGHITVNWYCDDGQAIFSVTDTGIGIAEKHLPRIAERFYRVDKARSRASGGTGLGLAIAKHVVMRHQGELIIKSELDVGSTFICRFPQNRAVVMKLS